ncbi:hypothetical protein E2C01_025535 [Portunus trituberculatus]|uniref:Uncharacterized protein n=1 Tax=Portunus trituberculatus TaxID=210409 RepID=A0A5B7EFZ4_PORTR|nr:hypothetical protein [Portunus trituberculatus]
MSNFLSSPASTRRGAPGGPLAALPGAPATFKPLTISTLQRGPIVRDSKRAPQKPFLSRCTHAFACCPPQLPAAGRRSEPLKQC